MSSKHHISPDPNSFLAKFDLFVFRAFWASVLAFIVGGATCIAVIALQGAGS